MATTSTYIYDPTGTSTDNLIVSEQHNVQPPSSITDASVFFLRAAPAFAESIVVRNGPSSTDTQLVEGQDYILTHQFLWKSYELSKGIYSSVTLINRNYTGQLYVDYQTLGGEFVLDDQTVLERLTRDIYKSRYVYWEQVAGLIPGLPPFDHSQAGTDTVGWGEVVDAILRLAAAITDTGNGSGTGTTDSSAALSQHIASTTAHKLASVGGSNLYNYAIASDADMDNQVANKYLNPYIVVAWMKRYVANLGLATAANDITALKQRCTVIEQTIATIQSNQTAFQQSLNNFGLSLQDMSGRQDDLENSLALAVADIPQMKDDIQSALDQLANPDPEIGNRVTTLETTVAQHSTDIDDIKTAALALASRVTNIEQDGTAAADITDLQTRVTALETQAGVFSGSITALGYTADIVTYGYDLRSPSFVLTQAKEIVIRPNESVVITAVGAGAGGPNNQQMMGSTNTRIERRLADGSTTTLIDIIPATQTVPGVLVYDSSNLTSVTVTPGAMATDVNGAAGITLNSVAYGHGGNSGTTDTGNNGGPSSASIIATYTNAGAVNVTLVINVATASTVVSSDSVTAGSTTYEEHIHVQPGNGAVQLVITT